MGVNQIGKAEQSLVLDRADSQGTGYTDYDGRGLPFCLWASVALAVKCEVWVVSESPSRSKPLPGSGHAWAGFREEAKTDTGNGDPCLRAVRHLYSLVGEDDGKLNPGTTAPKSGPSPRP